MLHSSFQKKLPVIIELFKNYKIKNAYIFGSAITDRFNDKSDIDILINFKDGLDPLEKGELMLNLQIELEDKLQREIDLLTENSMKNPYFIEELNEKKIKIYE